MRAKTVLDKTVSTSSQMPTLLSSSRRGGLRFSHVNFAGHSGGPAGRQAGMRAVRYSFRVSIPSHTLAMRASSLVVSLLRKPYPKNSEHLKCIDKRNTKCLTNIRNRDFSPRIRSSNFMGYHNTAFGPCICNQPSVGTLGEISFCRIRKPVLSLNPRHNLTKRLNHICFISRGERVN